MYEFRWPTRTLFGAGLAKRVDEFLEPPDEDACLAIVAPGETWAESLLGELTARLEAGGWSRVGLFTEVEANPSWETIERGQSFIHRMSADAVLAVGGGSVMDAAKVIAERGGAYTLCTMPTTAGTGGEISPWAVITNLEQREKESVVAMWPDMAILDPSLTVSMPALTTLYTGIDAFVHGLEAYLSSAANAITDSLALAGMRLAAENLDRVMNEPRDLAGRAAMLEASLLTGASMLHAGLGLMHAIGNVVGGLYHDLPHGLILAECMPGVLRYNRPVTADRLARIEDVVAEMQNLLEVWFGRLAVEKVSVEEDDLPLLAERAAANINARTNPRPAEKDQILDLARQAFGFESGRSRIGEVRSGEDA
jgi:alcohol dehydrogenase class IV